MTLPERLARVALPCRWPDAYGDRCTCGPCERRVDVEDAIREAIEAAAEIAASVTWARTTQPEHIGEFIAGAIRALLLTDEEPLHD